MSQAKAQVFQLKVSLQHSRPSICRRLLVASEYTLPQLHAILQVAMGWQNSHLYEFAVNGVHYSMPIERGQLAELGQKDARGVKLGRVAAVGDRFSCEYDYGDAWEHRIVVERALPPDPQQHLPVCLAGERACPPEDVGGAWGFATFRRAIQNPRHPEHDEYRDWFGGEFDPAAFDRAEVSRLLEPIGAAFRKKGAPIDALIRAVCGAHQAV